MQNRVPPGIKAKSIGICLIVEGHEEESYLNRLKELNVWDKRYEIKVVNAKSITNVAAAYEDKFKMNCFRLVLVFCDTDRSPYTQYQETKRQISLVHDGEISTAEKVIIYANPCSMQIVLSHFDDGVELRTQNKTKNAPKIAELTGVQNYKGHKYQIDEICRKIKQQSYYEMQERIASISKPDNETPSTNFADFLKCLQTSDCGWIDEINAALDEASNVE